MIGISLTVAVVLAAGCGDSGRSEPAGGPAAEPALATPIANSTATRAPAVSGSSAHAQYVAFAQAVNLRSQDVPGFRATPTNREQRKIRNGALESSSQYRRCFKAGKFPKALFKAGSEEFRGGRGLRYRATSSEVELAPSMAVARRELATVSGSLADPLVGACVTRLFDQLGAHSQPIRVGKASVRVQVGNLKLAPLQVNSVAAGTDGAFGLSLGMSVTYLASYRGRTLTVPSALHLEALAFLVGRGEVTLSTETLGKPFPAELEARLFQRLVSRALAARRQYPALAR